MEARLAEFREAVEEMPHGPRCATRLDSPDADRSCERMAILTWIDYVRDGLAD